MTSLRKYMPGITQGLIDFFAPGVAQGALVEILKHSKVTVEVINEWVQGNRSLWKQIRPEDRANLKEMAGRVSNVSWISSEWAINAVRQEMPAIASLFLGWPKARRWLDRQIEELKRELKS